MARIEDYLKETDEDLKQEINEAGEAQAEREELDIPDSVKRRFDGKSQDEVLYSYANLENKLSEQGQKMGDLRKSFDDYVLLQSRPSEPEPVEEPVTTDDLYENPENAVARVVKKETGNKLKEIEDQLLAVRKERALSDFERKFPEARTQAQTPEFVEWVKESPFRTRLAQQADAYDLEAAEELFGLYDDSTSASTKAAAQSKRKKDLKAATLETSSPATAETGDEHLSRTFIIQTKTAAKNGNRDAQAWLAENADAIALAYEEGRVVD